MDAVDYNPHSFARRYEDHTDLEGNEDQSATPRIGYYSAAPMFRLQFINIPPPSNMELSDYHPIPTTLYTGGRQRPVPEFGLQNDTRYGGNWALWLDFVAALIAMCVLLMYWIQMKFNERSPFETHLGFIIMSIASLFMAFITSGIWVNNRYTSPVFEVILKNIFWFTFINSLLSVLFILSLPPIYNWTGYVIVCAILLAITAVTFKSLKRLIASNRANNLGAFEMV